MTVIAWDGKTLAADRRSSNAGYIGSSVTKIHRWDGGLCAFSGDMDVGVQLVEWLRAGAIPVAYPPLQSTIAANFLVIYNDGRIARYERVPVPMFFDAGMQAMGGGRDYALAAMYLGRSARQAVEVAIALDCGCGNGIDELKLIGDLA